jgi:hypothetical protein
MFSIDVGSVRATFDALQGVSEVLAGKAALEAGMLSLRGDIEANVGVTDHSLRDLAGLDHPYARRHGSIQIHTRKPWTVHKQSGAMFNSLEDAITGGGSTGASLRALIWFNLGKAPHAKYVIEGTRVMLPRDVLWQTANDERVKKRTMKAIVRVLGKELKTKAKMRFTNLAGTKSSTGV